MTADALGLPLTANNEVIIDLNSLLDEVLDIENTIYNIPLPFDLKALEDFLPSWLLRFIRMILGYITIELPPNNILGEEINLGELVDGGLDIALADAVDALNVRELARLRIPLAPLLDVVIQLDGPDLALAHNYTLVEQFEDTNGKVPGGLGDTAIIDCHHANALLMSTYDKLIKRF